MKVDELLSTAEDAITVKRVYAEPYERDGLTVIPAALTLSSPVRSTSKDGNVRWYPAVDPTRVVTAVAFVVVAYLLTRPRMARIRALSAQRRARSLAKGH